ncbi:MAG: aminomethyltransferase family protein, partial [Gammaproteobacteria bacterium]
MSSRRLNMISDCEKSPWFDRTYNEKALYGDYAGRLVLLSIGNDQAAEYWELRKSVGLFDVPERPVEINGPDSVDFLNRMFTRPVDRLRVGRGSYNLLCHQGGGLVCDGILFRLAENRFWYVHADADVFLWLVAHAHDYAVEIRDPRSWVLQVQGPKSLDVLARACDGGMPAEFKYFDAFEGQMGGQDVLVSRTGWTNELGFEVYNMDPGVDGPALWDHLIAAGAEFGMRA